MLGLTDSLEPLCILGSFVMFIEFMLYFDFMPVFVDLNLFFCFFSRKERCHIWVLLLINTAAALKH